MSLRLAPFAVLGLLFGACGPDVDAADPAREAVAGPQLDEAWRALDPFTARIDGRSGASELDGEVTLWHPEGGKAAEGELRDGVRQGAWTFWHENGTVRWRGSFDQGVPTGEERAHYDNGQIHFEGRLDDGKRSGLYRYWYENGQLELEAEFRADQRHGKCRRWTRDGALDPAATGTYRKGRRIGEL